MFIAFLTVHCFLVCILFKSLIHINITNILSQQFLFYIERKQIKLPQHQASLGTNTDFSQADTDM